MKIYFVIADELPEVCYKCMLYDKNFGDCIALDENVWDRYDYQYPLYHRLPECPVVEEEDNVSE